VKAARSEPEKKDRGKERSRRPLSAGSSPGRWITAKERSGSGNERTLLQLTACSATPIWKIKRTGLQGPVISIILRGEGQHSFDFEKTNRGIPEIPQYHQEQLSFISEFKVEQSEGTEKLRGEKVRPKPDQPSVYTKTPSKK